jgi:hypothetical protein
MERPRMADRVSTYSRLLIALVSVLGFGLTPLYAQEPSEQRRQSLEPRLLERAELLRPGEDAVFLFGVSNPNGEEVRVDVPESSSDVQLIQLRVFPGRIEGVFDERWTAVELRLLPLRGGVFRYGPILFSTETRQGRIQSIRLDVVDDSLAARMPRFVWFGLEAPLVEGSSRIIALVADRSLPEGVRMQLDIPQNAILESLPVDEAQRNRGVVARYSLLPIAAGFLELGSARVFIEGFGELTVPQPRRLLVRPAAGMSTAEAASASTDALVAIELDALHEDSVNDVREIVFPELSPRHTSWTQVAAPAVAAAKDLLVQDGLIAAVAYLRRAERDSLLGFSIKGFREDFERLNGLPLGYAELWTPIWAIAGLFLVTILLLGVSFFAKVFKRPVSSRYFRMGLLSFFVMFLLLLLRLDSVGFTGRGERRLFNRAFYIQCQ